MGFKMIQHYYTYDEVALVLRRSSDVSPTVSEDMVVL